MKLSNLFLVFAILVSCNKEKCFSTKLIRGETWEVKEISVAGSSLNILGDWKVISDGTIFDYVPQVSWSFNRQSSLFQWQFQDKGKSFQLNYAQLCEECDGMT